MSKNENGYLNGNSLKSTDFFNSVSKGLITIPEMLTDINSFVDSDPSSFYRLVIGTDSQVKVVNRKEEIDYVSAIVIYRQGKGAKYYWRKIKIDNKPTLRDKIYMETLMSLDVAQKLVPEIQSKISKSKYDFEIHIDVGTIGPTREMIKEVVGMVSGSGFVAKTKPDSWAASSVADKYT